MSDLFTNPSNDYEDYLERFLDNMQLQENYFSIVKQAIHEEKRFVKQHAKIFKMENERPTRRNLYRMLVMGRIAKLGGALSFAEYQKSFKQNEPSEDMSTADFELLQKKGKLLPKYYAARFKNYDVYRETQRAVVKELRNFATNYSESLKQGIIYTLHGKAGTGKTHLSHAVLNYIMYHLGKPLQFRIWLNVVNELRHSYKQRSISEYDILNPLLNTRLLVLDEIGYQEESDHNLEKLTHIINHRQSHNKSTILITNQTDSEFKEFCKRQWERLHSRIFGNQSVLLSFNWDDYRKRKLE